MIESDTGRNSMVMRRSYGDVRNRFIGEPPSQCYSIADPHLTPLGEKQAQETHSAWVTERRFGVPLPEKFYTSPLTRAIRTHKITFDESIVSGIQTTIVENIREQAGIHTCDKRRTRSEIHEAFPEYTIEDGFTED
ncbi:hypothetical protein JVU11DRAFT_1966 [Chiua virens]|nr:hypothetical protein JVU11DRAFT_1966 [Chiua virens]